MSRTRSLQTGLDPRKIQQNREAERNIAQSARRLCDRIDLIVSSVQEKGEANDAAWKEDLITLFGGTDDEVKKREIRCRLLKNEVSCDKSHNDDRKLQCELTMTST